MRYKKVWIGAALLIVAPFVARLAPADDPKNPKGPDRDRPKAEGRVLVFGDGAARFNVTRDTTTGIATFSLADPSVKIASAPVVEVTTASGPKTLTLVPVSGQTGSWTLSDEIVRTERIDGTMRIVVDGKTYTAPLATVWVSESSAPAIPKWVARHGGRVIELTDCGIGVELVQEQATGTLRVYEVDGVTLGEAPVITLTETTGPSTVTLTKMDGDSAWVATNEVFKTANVTGRIKVTLNGKPCEGPLAIMPAGGAMHGGEIVVIESGPRFEVVRDPAAGFVTFYSLDETAVIENPAVVMTVNGAPKTYTLTRVEGEDRAWRLTGFDTKTSALDGTLRVSVSGKPMETRLHLFSESKPRDMKEKDAKDRDTKDQKYPK